MPIRSYTFIGGPNGDNAGTSVSSAGDVDGDGLDDILVGAPGAVLGGGTTPISYGYLLAAADLEAMDAADGTVDGVIDLANVDGHSGSYTFGRIGPLGSEGFTLSSAGDVDGDGLDDLLIGDPTGTSEGQTFLLMAADLASADATDGVANGVINLINVSAQPGSYRFVGQDSNGDAGASVSSAGDVDGDGRDDLLIGEPNAGNGASREGVAHLMTANDLAAADAADGVVDGVIQLSNVADQPGSYSFTGEILNYEAGSSVTSLGDIDGDGLDDLVIGSENSDDNGNRSGAIYITSSSDLAAADAADGMVDGNIDLANVAAQSNSYEIQGADPSSNTGNSIANVGDVDGDGVDDLLIGALLADGPNGINSGGAFLLTNADLAAADAADGSVDGVIDLANAAGLGSSYEFIGSEAGELAGASVSTAGDVDGDGREDLLIGSIDGVSYLVAIADLAAADAADGSVDGIIDLGNVNDQENSYEFASGTGFDNAGFSVSTAGDVDGDGLDDLVIGAPDGNSGGGYIINATDLAAADDDGTGQDGIINLGNLFFDGVVEGTSGADLIDKDFLGDPEMDRVDDTDNAAGTNDDVIQAGAGNDTIVASQGDDIIDGGAGRDTYVSGNLGNSYTFVGEGLVANSGSQVSMIDDIDGDGLSDFVISSVNFSATGPDTVETFIISSADLEAADAADGAVDGVINLEDIDAQPNSYQIIGGPSQFSTIRDISSAGDIDGDGLGDIIIGLTPLPGGGGAGSYLVTADGLAAADAADGSVDGVIAFDNIANQGGSYSFVNGANGEAVGAAVGTAGDFDGDGLDDILIGASGSLVSDDSGATYLLSAADLQAADAADGSIDGVINVDNISAQSGSFEVRSSGNSGESGGDMWSVGDIDGDGLDDFMVIGRNGAQGSFGESAYLISGADISLIDAADGNLDGVLNVGEFFDEFGSEVGQPGGQGGPDTNSYKFVPDDVAGSSGGEGLKLAGGADLDGDGINDLVIGEPDNPSPIAGDAGSVYFISGTDLAAADAADGTIDGTIQLNQVHTLENSYEFRGEGDDDRAGISLSIVDDTDGDGLSDVLISAFNGLGNDATAYLVSSADFAAADAADGVTDGIVDLENVHDQSESYQFVGIRGNAITGGGDVDGDGIGDFLIGSPGTTNGLNFENGESYLISGVDLEALDALDGSTDGIISVGVITRIDDTVTLDVNDEGDGTVTGTYVTGTDTLTSVENYVAGENSDEADAITITDTGSGYLTTDISGLDDASEGTFVPGNGDPVVSFGPGTGVVLSDVIQDIQNGTYFSGGAFQITGGDETGQVGNISFENFETINFDVVCFARGTKIATKYGTFAIEDLAEGDRVMTLDNGYCPIRWIGSCTLDAISLTLKPKLKPIRIKAGALGRGMPDADLLVSPQHRVLVRSEIARRMFGETEVLVAANKLLALDGFDIEEDVESVEYFHMLFDQHEIVFSNGAPTESLFTGPEALKSVAPEARAEIQSLFPDILAPDFAAVPARSIPEKGRQMRRLAERHQSNEKPLLSL
ncbi:Hint domain-containing protein [Gymnodinialimonas sp.]